MKDFINYVNDYFERTYSGDTRLPGFQESKNALLERLDCLYRKELLEGHSHEEAACHALIRIGMNQLVENETWNYTLNRKALKFERYYPKLIRIGLWAIFLIPLVFLCLMFSMNSKLVYLILWIISIILIAAFLIVIDYIHDRLNSSGPNAGPQHTNNIVETATSEEEPHHADHI